MPRRGAADESGVNNLGDADGEALSAAAPRDDALMNRGSFDSAGPSVRRPMGGCGPSEATGMGECELDAQEENSNCGQSRMLRKINRGKLRERAHLDALLLPRTKRRKVDPVSADKVNSCSQLPQQAAASKRNRGNGKRGRSEQD